MHANYIREDIAREAVKLGYILRNDTTIVCTPVSGIVCTNTKGMLDINVLILNEYLNKQQEFFLTFKVIEMTNEMIIGLPSIREHDLTLKCRSQFINTRDSKRSRTDTNNTDTDLSTSLSSTVGRGRPIPRVAPQMAACLAPTNSRHSGDRCGY